jgi:hypothetical protein
MVGLVANSQVVTLTLTKGQNFTHDANISTYDAMNSNLIEYPYHTVGKNVFTFDLNTKKLTIESCDGVFVYDIVYVEKGEDVVNCIVVYDIGKTIFLLGKTSDGDEEFLMESIEGNEVIGFFSMSEDFSYTVE